MNGKPWLLLDTETTGFAEPVFVVELAAQRMCGWEPDGEPFRKLLNQNAVILAEASRVHGYTREILERDGEPPRDVDREFAEYAGRLPLVSFNLEYDLDEVLKPEWKRLGLAPIGSSGRSTASRSRASGQLQATNAPAVLSSARTRRTYGAGRRAHRRRSVRSSAPANRRASRPGHVGKARELRGGGMVSIPNCLWKTQGPVVPRSTN